MPSTRDFARNSSSVSSGYIVSNVFHFKADNIGDRLCGPAQYFFQDRVRNESFDDISTLSNRVIVGGGQVFSQLRDLARRKECLKRPLSLAAWGVGLPLRGKKDQAVLKTVQRFDVFGTRNFDWTDVLDFVPCASCMSPLFDTVADPTHEVVVYAHRRKTPDLVVPEGIPVLTNRLQPAEDVIKFIASGQTVVTSSYHGVYWAQLLGRRVLCVPFNDKFYSFEHNPRYASQTDWLGELNQAQSAPPVLETYRSINRRFFRKVVDRWSSMSGLSNA